METLCQPVVKAKMSWNAEVMEDDTFITHNKGDSSQSGESNRLIHNLWFLR